jgi:hypothetical protein
VKTVRDTSGADVSAAFETFMEARDGWFVVVDLFDITLLTLGWPRDGAGHGMTLRYTTSEYDVPWGGEVYQGGYAYAGIADHEPAPRIERGVIKTVIGTEVATMSLSFLLDGTELLPPAAAGADPFGLAEAIGAGLFEGAHVKATRLFLSNHPDFAGGLKPASFDAVIVGGLVLFAGQITETKLTRSKADLTVSSYMVRLNIGVPIHVYQPQCRRTLYDFGCTFSRTGTIVAGLPTPVSASAQLTGAVGTTPAPSTTIVPISSSLPSHFFDLGTLQFTSGAMAGLQRPINEWANFLGNQWAFLLAALPRVPQTGDGVLLQAGCDKNEDTCRDKFNNLANFSGEPKTPPADTAV